MLPDPRPLRLLGLLLAALQLVLPGAATVAEAHLAGELERVAHVEEYATDCEYLDHPAQCAVCQFLRSAASAGASPPSPPAAAERRGTAPETTGLACGSASAFFPLPRSPPSRS